MKVELRLVDIDGKRSMLIAWDEARPLPEGSYYELSVEGPTVRADLSMWATTSRVSTTEMRPPTEEERVLQG
jgi:hypothetical protein